MRIAQIDEFPNYMVSSDGQIFNRKGKPLVQSNRYRRYKSVTLCKKGKRFSVSVHRIVATAFIPNPNNYPCVNHKDENTENNDVSNLEWCTHEYNNKYGTRSARMAKSQVNRKDCSKRVAQYNTDGQLIAEYPSTKEASRQTGVYRSGIGKCCNGYKQETAGGYVWRWA